MRKKKYTFFLEGNQYSWRKIMTAICLIIFAAAEVGFLVTHHFEELPPSYQAINAGIFGFYFTKTILRNIKVNATTTEKP